MPRNIPILLKDHLRHTETTTTILLKVSPVTPGFSDYGVTELDRDIVYNDGYGDIRYHAAIGMVPSTVLQSTDMAVDNAEFVSLLPEYDIEELSEDAIRAGAYDYAKFSLYLVNYEDLSQGHITIQSGTIGQVTIRSDGLSFVNELRGLVAQLKQSICEKDSLTCRAIFGSQPVGSLVPGPQVKWGWCGFNAVSLLTEANVVDVGFESNLTFRVTIESGWEEDHLSPGIVKFTSGLNNGRTFEISENTSDGWITLAHETPFPISAGDTVEYRPDCNKHARDEEKGCKYYFEDLWIEHFRGEPDIPIADERALSVPGAGVGPGQGGTTNVPIDQE